MVTRAVVHIGPVKTGSTALAVYFTRATARGLLPADVVYPTGDLWFGRTSKGATRQCPEIAALKRLPDGSQTFVTPGVEEQVAKVAKALRELPGKNAKTAVFIVETATHAHPVDLIQRLFTDNFDEVVFVMVARRQDKAAASTLSQDIKTPHLSRTNLDPRLRAPEFGLPFGEFNHLRNFQRWATGPSNYKFVAIPYLEGEHGSFTSIERFHRAGNITGPVDLPGIEGHRIHPTFSRDGLEALVKIKRQIARWGWLPGYRARALERSQKVTKTYLAAANSDGIEPSGKKFVPYSFSSDEKSWILDQFRDTNLALFDLVKNGPFGDDWAKWKDAL